MKQLIPTRHLEIYKKAAIICLGSFQMGYLLVVFNPVQNRISILNDWQEPQKSNNVGLITSAIAVGGSIGTLVSMKLIKLYSLRSLLILSEIIMALGTIVTVISFEFSFLLYGRIIQGLSIGLLSTITPLLLKEISPPSISSVILSFNQAFICIGTFICFLVSLMFMANDNDLLQQRQGADTNSNSNINQNIDSQLNQWRSLFILPLFVCIFHLIWLIKESISLPALQKSTTTTTQVSEDEEERKIIQPKNQEQLDTATTHETNQLTSRTKEETLLKMEDNSEQLSIEKKFSESKTQEENNHNLWVAIAISTAQQVCGINAIMFYSGAIFSESYPTMAQIFSLFLGAILIATSLTGGVLSDNFGKKSVLLGGMVILLFVNFCFIVCELIHFSFGSVIAICFFVLYFGISLGPAPSMIFPEILTPQQVGIANFVLWFWTIVIGLVFPQMLNYFGLIGSFAIFWGLLAACLIFLIFTFQECTDDKDKIKDHHNDHCCSNLKYQKI